MKKEKVSTINDLVYCESDEHVDTISDSIKQVDASNKPITDTQIVEGVNNLSVVIRGDVCAEVLKNACSPANHALGDALSNDYDSNDGWLDTYDSD